MAKLNDKNENTQKIIHLMITEKCNRKCPYCCNNQYDINKIEIVTKEEMNNAEIIFLTGGEPFAYADPCNLARQIKINFPNIKKVFVYTNAIELADYIRNSRSIYSIDGVTVSIKNKRDKEDFEQIIAKNKDICNLESNWLYVFPGFQDTIAPKSFIKKMRYWQKDFTPASDSIFRRLY